MARGALVEMELSTNGDPIGIELRERWQGFALLPENGKGLRGRRVGNNIPATASPCSRCDG
jgi:hypothetical protein